MRCIITFLLATLSLSVSAQQATTTDPVKIAVIPFTLKEAEEKAKVAVGENVQRDAHRIISKNSGKNIVQDLKTTRNLLEAANISVKEIELYDVEKLAAILGVDYIVGGSLMIPNREQLTTVRTYTTIVSSNGSSPTPPGRSQQPQADQAPRFDVDLVLEIYKADGSRLFQQKRTTAVQSLQNSGSSALDYLWRRSSLYAKP